MRNERHPAWDQIEAAVTPRDDPMEGRPVASLPSEHAIELSKAISLKRIADALSGGNAYGEQGFEMIAGEISRSTVGGGR